LWRDAEGGGARVGVLSSAAPIAIGQNAGTLMSEKSEDSTVGLSDILVPSAPLRRNLGVPRSPFPAHIWPSSN
jgi:hypothetical protein